jgi:hypothetical protein
MVAADAPLASVAVAADSVRVAARTDAKVARTRIRRIRGFICICRLLAVSKLYVTSATPARPVGFQPKPRCSAAVTSSAA